MQPPFAGSYDRTSTSSSSLKFLIIFFSICYYLTINWNGKHQKDGTPLPTGTYVYEMYLQDFEGWKHKEYGQIFIVR